MERIEAGMAHRVGRGYGVAATNGTAAQVKRSGFDVSLVRTEAGLQAQGAQRVSFFVWLEVIVGDNINEECFMKLHHTVQIWQKGEWFIARCPELDFVSQGRSPTEAQNNLMEVMEIQFEEMIRMGTLVEYMDECGYLLRENTAVPLTEMVSFQKILTQFPVHA